VVLVFLLQFLWFAWPRFSLHGPIIEERYRNGERMEAHRAWMQHPSPSAESAYRQEDELLYTHLARRAQAGIGGLIIRSLFLSASRSVLRILEVKEFYQRLSCVGPMHGFAVVP
jgi:hypothetical protein